MLSGNVSLVERHEAVAHYRRCYDVPSEKEELFVTIKLNSLPAYDCISAMDVSFSVSDVKGCSRYIMYKVPAIPIVGIAITMTYCKATADEAHVLFSYCLYRCEPAMDLAFGGSNSSRFQSGMTICDLRWNYDAC